MYFFLHDTARALNHNHVVKCFGAGMIYNKQSKTSEFFIVMEKMASNLADFVFNKSNKVSFIQQLMWAKQIISALRYLHTCDIVHRDLKLTNVLVHVQCCLVIFFYRLTRRIKCD